MEPHAAGFPPGAEALRGRLLDGRYRLGPRIARGGMASVYEALDVRLDRTVAVKIMHADLSDSGDEHDFAARFVREARAAARLSHPNVVAVYDQGDDDGTIFLAMELVTGHTLRDTIAKESPMAPARALALMEPVLSALASAHRAGLVHRDVKPENVLISDDGRVKVADFGLAKAISADTQHTATQGILIGTVSYLAPELVTDGTSDERADVYAAGVVLYELLTGAKPHEGESPIQVAYRHVHHDVPPPSERVPDLPEYVDALVARATARDRGLRPADAGVLLHQLHRVSQALADGVRDDPELTLDLSPYVGADRVVDDAQDDAQWDDVAADHEPTTALPVLAPPPPPPPVRREARPTPPTRQPKPPTARRSRRGPLLLALLLVIALVLGGGAFWYGWARYTASPTVVGQDQASAVEALEGADLEVAYADPVYDADLPAGTVVDADPGGGARVLPGDTVTLTLSLGQLLVPKVRGLDEDAAQDALLERQLEFGKSVPRYSEKVPEGEVLTSVPPAGTELEPGDSVDLVISRGREPIKVRSWVGDTIDEATEAIERRGLVAEVVEERFDATVPDDVVISQSPAEGRLFRNDVVSLVVSKGPELVEVPGVNFAGVDAATQTMRDAGFDVEVKDAEGSFGLGFVVDTDPPAGEMVPIGSTITLFVA